jgi:hypothetical protein
LTSRRSGLEIVGLALVVIASVLPFLLVVGADPDLWWHVRSGQRILADGALPAVDDWSFTATGQAWTNHEWLSDVIMARLFDFAGAPGLLALRGLLLVLLVVGLVVAFSHRLREPLLVLLVVLFTMPVLGVFINARAHTFTYTLTVWTVVVLDRVKEERWRWLGALPLMLMLWANLHGGFVLGLGLVGLMLFLVLIGRDGIPLRPVGRPRTLIIAAGLATLGATLINPYGFGLFTYLVSELGANHSIISEWQPVSGAQVGYFWGYLLLPIALWLAARSWNRVGLLVMLLLTSWSAWNQARFFVLVGLFGSLLAAEALGTIVARLRDRSGPPLVDRLFEPKAAVVGVGALAAAVAVPFALGLIRGEARVDVDTAVYPIGATEWLAAQDVGPNLAVTLAYGGYSIWHLGPETRVAVDGRNLTVYDDEWVDSYLRALRDGRALDVLDEETVDVWMLPADSKQVSALEATGRWGIAYRDAVAVVVLRAPVAPAVVGEQPPSPVEFP